MPLSRSGVASSPHPAPTGIVPTQTTSTARSWLRRPWPGGHGMSHASVQRPVAVPDAATLTKADLADATLTETRLAFADLTGAIYAPSSPPLDPYLEGIQGLSTVIFRAGSGSGLVQLWELLQKAGLRDLERQATYILESNRTRHTISGWSGNPIDRLEGAFGLFQCQHLDLPHPSTRICTPRHRMGPDRLRPAIAPVRLPAGHLGAHLLRPTIPVTAGRSICRQDRGTAQECSPVQGVRSDSPWTGDLGAVHHPLDLCGVTFT
jgi:hypothetical protein